MRSRTSLRSGPTGRSRRRLLALGTGIGLAASAQALAQAPQAPRPPTRDEVERPLESEAPRPPRLTVEGGIERSPCALSAPEYEDLRFTLRDVRFEGPAAVDRDMLRPAYAPFVGSEHPVAVICEIRDRAATLLRDAGYVAAVEIPEQRLGDGSVRFDLLVARLVALRVRGDAGRAERTIARYLERLTDEPLFNRRQAERYLLLAGDLPGYDVRLALRSAGAGPGEVVGEVTVVRYPGLIDASIQNFGATELGRWGGLARIQFYGLTGLGDRTSFAFFTTADFHEQQTVHAAHEFRVGAEGLTLAGEILHAWADPGLGDPALDVESRTLLASLEASYPLVRTQARTVRAGAGFELVDQKVGLDALPLTRDKLRVAFARIEAERTDEGSFGRLAGYTPAEPRWRLFAAAELRQGLSLLGATEDCGPAFALCTAPGAVPPSRLEADATATVFRAEAAAEFRPVPRVTFALGARAQHSARPLLSFEEFSAGNYTIGRGYDPGTLLGDSGWGVQAELRYGTALPTGPRAWALQPFAFFDHARVENEDRVFAFVGPERLSSTGAGLRAAYGDRARLEVVLAVPLQRAGLLAERPDPRILVSLSTRFWPGSF